MGDTVYKQARKRAAKKDPRLKSCEKAQNVLGIERTRLLRIEGGKLIPHPEDVGVLAQAYEAPELINYYCTKQCPLGRERGMEPLVHNDLDRIIVLLMTSLHTIERVEDELCRIFEDGKVSEEEKKDFKRLINTLSKIAYSAESLKLWADCNGFKSP